MKDGLVASTVALRDPAVPTPGISVPTEVTFGAIATGAIVWGAAFIRGQLKKDAAEKIELAAAVKRADEAFDTLSTVVADLQVAVAKCETHREHDERERKRQAAEIEELKARQIARIVREADHE